MRRVFAMWLSRHAWWLLMLLGACLALAFVDAGWATAAVILYVIALLMLFTLVYFNYAFSPVARWSVMTKTVFIDARGLHLTFDHPRMNDHTLLWRDITLIQFTADATVIHIKGAPINFITLPPLTPEQRNTLKALYLA